jgi:hypothetical protein
MPAKRRPTSDQLEKLRAIRCKVEAEQLRRRKRENEIAEGRLVLKADLDARDLYIATRQKAALIAALESELPARLAGLDPAQIRLILRGVIDQICDLMQELLEDYARNQPTIPNED